MNKVKSMLRSRRFWAATVGVAAVVSAHLFDYELNQDQVVGIVTVVVAWIIGDTVRETK